MFPGKHFPRTANSIPLETKHVLPLKQYLVLVRATQTTVIRSNWAVSCVVTLFLTASPKGEWTNEASVETIRPQAR